MTLNPCKIAITNRLDKECVKDKLDFKSIRQSLTKLLPRKASVWSRIAMIDMAQSKADLLKKNHSGVTKKLDKKNWQTKLIGMNEMSMEQVFVLIVAKELE